jgi:hypothetical protein
LFTDIYNQNGDEAKNFILKFMKNDNVKDIIKLYDKNTLGRLKNTLTSIKLSEDEIKTLIQI